MVCKKIKIKQDTLDFNMDKQAHFGISFGLYYYFFTYNNDILLLI